MEHLIHVLDQSTVDKIAAGEVVERPASVVKELVENSIDAGADRITIEIKDGGISMIRISDNGKGIAPEDIPLAFLRHATSKIVTVQDLSSLNSLGFRGEALSSIAAVSRVEMITKRPEDISGTRYVVEGGREKLKEEIGAPDGTTLIVRDLFYNTPARAKFLKTPMTEASHVGAFAEQLILSHPDIAFQFRVNGQMKISSTGNGSLRDAVYHVYGREIVSELIELDEEADGISLKGFIAKPQVSRGNRNYENYYVNGRYVRSKVISRAVEDGYTTRLMQHQYPFTCLFLTVDGTAVDVNVHPSKMEVRFSDDKKIYDLISGAVKKALLQNEMILESSFNTPEKSEEKRLKEETAKTPKVEPFETKASGMIKEAGTYQVSNETSGSQGQVREEGASHPIVHMTKDAAQGETNPKETLPPEKTRQALDTAADAGSSKRSGAYVQQSFLPEFLSKEASPMRRIVGQVFQTYWIFEYGDKMYVMDQHAAHERVLFERFMKNYESRKISSQYLSPPVIITLTMQEEQLLNTYMDAFQKLGFEIEPFGGRDFAIRAVPYDLGTIDSGDLFLSLLNNLEVSQKVEDLDIYIHRVATEACKAAVKGGGELSVEEAKSLVDQLFECEDPYHCPHGRPTIFSISRSDLEKKFKRIV